MGGEGWFRYNVINKEFGTKGKARILYKLHGEGKTDLSADEALIELKEGLRDERKAYIVGTLLRFLIFVLMRFFVKIDYYQNLHIICLYDI